MPELPEIETLKLSLQALITDLTIVKVELRRPNLRYTLNVGLEEAVLNGKILNLARLAKYLILELSNDNALIIHLGMSGRFTFQHKDYFFKKHDHVIFHLNTGEYLVFNDARRFGMVETVLLSELLKHKFFKNLGPEPLSEKFNAGYFCNQLKGKKVPIKNSLMDNKIVVGIGNIYASESLFLSKINPLRPSNSLSLDEIERLIIAAKEVLAKAIAAGGTTLRDFISGDNSPGYFKQKLFVYGRAGKNCLMCDDTILKIRQAGRATFYCPTCQKL